jgi:hypothetical protein
MSAKVSLSWSGRLASLCAIIDYLLYGYDSIKDEIFILVLILLPNIVRTANCSNEMLC